jgi:hypothetical protein
MLLSRWGKRALSAAESPRLCGLEASSKEAGGSLGPAPVEGVSAEVVEAAAAASADEAAAAAPAPGLLSSEGAAAIRSPEGDPLWPCLRQEEEGLVSP